MQARIDLALEYIRALSAGDKDEAPETPGWYLEKILCGEAIAFCPDCGEPVPTIGSPYEWGDNGYALCPPSTVCVECRHERTKR
jgi:hypothetical protein